MIETKHYVCIRFLTLVESPNVDKCLKNKISRTVAALRLNKIQCIELPMNNEHTKFNVKTFKKVLTGKNALMDTPIKN